MVTAVAVCLISYASYSTAGGGIFKPETVNMMRAMHQWWWEEEEEEKMRGAVAESFWSPEQGQRGGRGAGGEDTFRVMVNCCQ